MPRMGIVEESKIGESKFFTEYIGKGCVRVYAIGPDEFAGDFIIDSNGTLFKKRRNGRYCPSTSRVSFDFFMMKPTSHITDKLYWRILENEMLRAIRTGDSNYLSFLYGIEETFRASDAWKKSMSESYRNNEKDN